MKSVIDRFLSKSFLITKKILLSNKRIRNAVFDVYNNEEFSDFYEHEKMLADAKRVDTYQQAISKLIGPGDIVVDLGTGSGILSLFAVQSHAKKVYAIDHSEFIEIAKEVSLRNGGSEIIFEKVNSRSFNPPEKMDVILHEQIGDDLFDENMIENIFDLKRRILKPGGRVIPGKFELFLEPVSLKPEFRVPYIWENKLHGVDFSFLEERELGKKYKPAGYRFRYLPPYSIDFFLCKPEPVLSFDLNDDISEIDFRIKPQKRFVKNDGTLDGLCLYFITIFDDETQFDTSPANGHHSWSNRFFRTERVAYLKGEQLSFNVHMPSPLIANTWDIEMQEPVKYHL